MCCIRLYATSQNPSLYIQVYFYFLIVKTNVALHPLKVGTMEIFVKPGMLDDNGVVKSAGHNFHVLYVNREDTIEDVKGRLLVVPGLAGTSASQLRLIFEGNQLEDGRTLSSYNIGVGATLYMVLRKKKGTQERADVKADEKADVKADVKADDKADVKANVRGDDKADVKAAIKAVVKAAIKDEVRNQMLKMIKCEVRSQLAAQEAAKRKREEADDSNSS